SKRGFYIFLNPKNKSREMYHASQF
ncbi:hypothetical protein PMI16_00454, partial [Herbaspirillum sp. CF444]